MKQTFPNDPEFLSAEDVAKILGVSSRTVRRMRAAGLITFYRLGHRVFYKRAEAIEAIERLKVPAKNEKI